MPCGAKMIFPTLQIGKNVGRNLKPASLLEDSFLVMVCEDGSLARATDLSSSQKSVSRPALVAWTMGCFLEYFLCARAFDSKQSPTSRVLHSSGR